MSLNEIKQQDATSEQQKTDSKTNYEDCFVYDESRFTGIEYILYFVFMSALEYQNNTGP